ncbi:MAG: CueP family metal-binding protein [Thaumarchaeota archaeon]|nr:CueP family metal-binding protein [Nitrososphaerota archaeon]MCL5317467.1 CueP family metal-binding protein [Nitrososphaerota archaeon]
MVDAEGISDKVVTAPAERRRAIAVFIIIVSLIGFAGLLTYQTALTAEKDRFYLSIGLYANYTHECYYHNPGTCDAQFKSTPVKYRIESLDGSFLLENTVKTTDKGWLDFYLPKNQKYNAEFELQGMRGSGVISTEADARTCISTIKVN